MPVDGRHLIQVIGHVDGDVFPFLEPQDRSGRRAIVTNAFLDEITGVDLDPVDRKIILPGARREGEDAAREGG